MTFNKNQMISEKLRKLAKEREEDFPLVIENGLFLWDEALDHALYELEYEIDEFDATEEYPSSSEFEHLLLFSRNMGTPPTMVRIVKVDGDQYVAF